MGDNKNRGRKKFGWLIFFTVMNWILIALMIWRVDPDTVRNFILPESYLPMILLLAGGFFWILVILTMSTTKALRWTIGIMLFITLRMWSLGTAINGLLILGFMISLEVYFYNAKAKKNPTNEVGEDKNKEV